MLLRDWGGKLGESEFSDGSYPSCAPLSATAPFSCGTRPLLCISALIDIRWMTRVPEKKSWWRIKTHNQVLVETREHNTIYKDFLKEQDCCWTPWWSLHSGWRCSSTTGGGGGKVYSFPRITKRPAMETRHQQRSRTLEKLFTLFWRRRPFNLWLLITVTARLN